MTTKQGPFLFVFVHLLLSCSQSLGNLRRFLAVLGKRGYTHSASPGRRLVMVDMGFGFDDNFPAELKLRARMTETQDRAGVGYSNGEDHDTPPGAALYGRTTAPSFATRIVISLGSRPVNGVGVAPPIGAGQ